MFKSGHALAVAARFDRRAGGGKLVLSLSPLQNAWLAPQDSFSAVQPSRGVTLR